MSAAYSYERAVGLIWEFVLPNSKSGEASLAVEQLGLSALRMDGDAFAAFYLRSARPLWAYLARVSQDPGLADDLMQESFVRFLCARGAPAAAEGEVASRRYLFQIATNLLKDHWRKPRARSIEDVPEEFFAASADDAREDSQAVLGPALKKLRLRDRQILWLAHAEGYSHREIAEVTGLGTASIRLLLFRARRRIAAILREQGTQASQAGRAR